MADESDIESDASAKNARVSGFKCCANKNCHVCVCINCYSIYHNSCITRMGKVKRTIDNTKIECCTRTEKVSGVDSNVVGSERNELHKVEMAKMSMEIEYLKKMLEELSDKNNILKQNNSLLCEKIGNLESAKNVNINQSSKQTRRSYRDVAIESIPNSTSIPLSSTQTQVPANGDNVGRGRGDSNGSVGLSIPKTNLRHPHVSPDVEIDDVKFGLESSNSQQAPFQLVSDRRRRRRKNLGTGRAEPNFEGGDRKAWLYVSRVKRTASEEIIKNYIQDKDGFQGTQITVYEIPTEEDQLKAFLVIAPLEKKDEMYDSSFWPKYINVGRFNFDKHRDFLRNLKKNPSQQRGGNFL